MACLPSLGADQATCAGMRSRCPRSGWDRPTGGASARPVRRLLPGGPSGCRWATIVGPAAVGRKGASPPLRPPTYPHERAFAERLCGPSVCGPSVNPSGADPDAAGSPRPGRRSAATGGRRRAPGPRTGRRRGAGSRRGRPSPPATRRPRMPRSRPTSPPCSRGTSGIRARGRARASAWPVRARRTSRA